MLATEIVSIPVEINGDVYTPDFMRAVRGGGAWSREARILLALAAASGARLDEKSLVLKDVRDLRAMRDTLTRRDAR